MTAVILPGFCHCTSLKYQQIWVKISSNLQMNPKEVSVADNRPNQTCSRDKMLLQRDCASLREAQGSIKYLFHPCSEDLLAHSGGASGIIIGTVLPRCLQSYCPVLTKKDSSCLVRGKQMNWQRRGSGCQSEGTKGLPSHCVCPLVTYRTHIIPSVEASEVHGPLRSDLQKTASIAISVLVHIMKN